MLEGSLCHDLFDGISQRAIIYILEVERNPDRLIVWSRKCSHRLPPPHHGTPK